MTGRENGCSKRTKIGTLRRMNTHLTVCFYSTDTGTEPVREWLKSLSNCDRKTIGEDIKTVQFGWPIGMPLVRALGGGLWEVRIRLDNRIARLIFCVEKSSIVLLHGFIKKQQSTPITELDLAKQRLRQIKRSTQ